MVTSQDRVYIAIYPREKQGTGAFDGGRITEVKPIGFPGEGPGPTRIGPLFYWAWASANGYGKIGLHPHRGFEIMSYVIQGEIGHRDTLGTTSRVTSGGAQVMQTGSGVSHEEETFGDHTEFFQIWLEPDLQEAVKRTPTYRDYHHEDFPRETRNGVTTKTIIGGRAPISLVTRAEMQEVTIESGADYRRPVKAGQSVAVLTLSGNGTLVEKTAKQSFSLKTDDFGVIHANEDMILSFTGTDSSLRLTVIEIPTKVGYPLL